MAALSIAAQYRTQVWVRQTDIKGQQRLSWLAFPFMKLMDDLHAGGNWLYQQYYAW